MGPSIGILSVTFISTDIFRATNSLLESNDLKGILHLRIVGDLKMMHGTRRRTYEFRLNVLGAGSSLTSG